MLLFAEEFVTGMAQHALDAHIPSKLFHPALTMTSSVPVVGNVPTIFVGIVDGTKYTDEMWHQHKALLADLFQITDYSCTCEMKIGSLNPLLIDAERLQREFTASKQ